eukprot:7429272-Pyramimonas_sp.AAC.1
MLGASLRGADDGAPNRRANVIPFWNLFAEMSVHQAAVARGSAVWRQSRSATTAGVPIDTMCISE